MYSDVCVSLSAKFSYELVNFGSLWHKVFLVAAIYSIVFVLVIVAKSVDAVASYIVEQQ